MRGFYLGLVAMVAVVLSIPGRLGDFFRVALVSTALSLLASPAVAAVDATATAALATAVTDVGVAGLAVLLVIIAIMGFKWLQATII